MQQTTDPARIKFRHDLMAVLCLSGAAQPTYLQTSAYETLLATDAAEAVKRAGKRIISRPLTDMQRHGLRAMGVDVEALRDGVAHTSRATCDADIFVAAVNRGES
jgi:hypothetical protein